YVQRWAGLATQVKPKLSDEEDVSMLINTLQRPVFYQMIGNIHLDLCRLITTGERIENPFWSDKIKKNFANKVKIQKRKPHSHRTSTNLKRLIFHRNHVLPLQMVEKGGSENEKGRVCMILYQCIRRIIAATFPKIIVDSYPLEEDGTPIPKRIQPRF
ncbi:hypothetical protein Lal_00046410, partial [Lupinus albus]